MSTRHDAEDATHADKICDTCGRIIEWRRKWAASWEQVRYCSQGCRRQRPNETDEALERAILELLADRPRQATLCPSEAARRVSDDWRDLMERTRRAARRLVARGQVVMTQGGRVVDPSTARGPIRIRRA